MFEYKLGEGNITLVGAATFSNINIEFTKATSTTLTVTDKTNSPVTVGSLIKNIDASKRNTAVKITGNSLTNKISGGSGADSIFGGGGNDSILGGAGNDKLFGGNGNDCIKGGAGKDSILGGAGNDSLWGDDGADKFFYAKGDGKDIIYGFDNKDTLTLDNLDFTTTYNKSSDYA